MKQIRFSGFTLIELMIVVVIIGVLAAIAYPSYTKYTVQSRRSDAQIALTQAAALQERFYSDCGHYAQIPHGVKNTRACGTLANNYNDGILAMNDNASATIFSPGQHYVISMVAPTSSTGICPIDRCFILQATPSTKANTDGTLTGTGLQVGNGRLRIDSKGNKSWDKANSNSPSGTTGMFGSKWTDK
ncbi:MAG: type IV pilin protein [Sulfuricaulis sp.]